MICNTKIRNRPNKCLILKHKLTNNFISAEIKTCFNGALYRSALHKKYYYVLYCLHNFLLKPFVLDSNKLILLNFNS